MTGAGSAAGSAGCGAVGSVPVPRLCIDCAHCFVPMRLMTGFIGPSRVQDIAHATCKRTDLVDGSGRNGSLCSIERMIGGCGAEARHFEVKA